jgi:hypothetical protein
VYEQQPPQQPWGPQQPASYPPQGDGGGAVAVTLKYHPLAFLLGLFKPRVELNGHHVQAGWGRTAVPVPPGQYQVHVHVPYLLPPRIGVAVQPGQTVELEYRAPMIAFLRGALGAPPQKYPGMTASIVLLVISLVLLLCVCGGLIVAAANGGSSSSAGLPALGAVQAIAGNPVLLLR